MRRDIDRFWIEVIELFTRTTFPNPTPVTETYTETYLENLPGFVIRIYPGGRLKTYNSTISTQIFCKLFNVYE